MRCIRRYHGYNAATVWLCVCVCVAELYVLPAFLMLTIPFEIVILLANFSIECVSLGKVNRNALASAWESEMGRRSRMPNEFVCDIIIREIDALYGRTLPCVKECVKVHRKMQQKSFFLFVRVLPCQSTVLKGTINCLQTAFNVLCSLLFAFTLYCVKQPWKYC